MTQTDAKEALRLQIEQITNFIDRAYAVLHARLEQDPENDKEKIMTLREAQIFIEGVREEADQILVAAEHMLSMAQNFERYVQSVK